jgi:SNF2 family DNA or RNA helicase
MIVLHAALLARALFLWGEKSLQSTAIAKRSRARARATPGAAVYPFVADADALRAALKESLPNFTVAKERVTTLIAWLPSSVGQPIASHPLIAPTLDANERVTVAPWTVWAIRLDARDVLELLGVLGDKPTLSPGVLAGNDLIFWATALRFASALVTRQQFLPGLIGTDGKWLAAWDGVFTGVDVGRVAKLAQAMPHACRALTRDGTAAPELPASSVLTTFLNMLVDQLVRSAFPEKPETVQPGRQRRAGERAFDSLHDYWFHALRTPDGHMTGDERELMQLAEQIREWRRPIAVTAAAPVKLCFRLEEPAEPETEDPGKKGQVPNDCLAVEPQTGPWRVSYLLQPADDPSLLVEACEVWKKRSEKAELVERPGFRLKEYLLSALGQAAGLCPRIEASLACASPSGYELDAEGAHEFLMQKAWSLEQAGFGVLLPAWWTGKGARLRLSARARVNSPEMQGGSGLTLNQLLSFNWEIALGSTTLTLDELEMLARLKTALVKIRGQWVQLNAQEIQAAIELWKKKGVDQATVRDLIQVALGAKPTVAGLAFDGVSATGWIADLLAQLEGRAAFESFASPNGFQGQLRPYQVRGFSWLAFLRRWGLGACLADDMGLGKTIQVLTLIQHDWERGKRTPVLLVCPTSVVGNWQKEAARFTPGLPVLVHHGTERIRGSAFAESASRHAIVVSSFSLLYRDFELFRTMRWAALVLDEAQNIKNPETRQARAARSVDADARVALTGTPVENNVGDLWSIMEFLNPGFLGSQSDFKRRFFLPIQVNRDPQATERLKRLTGPFILRRLKTDKAIIADLPEKQEMKVFCPLTKEQASLYAAVVKDATEALDQAEGIQRKGLVLATLVKLKQVCNHPRQFLGDHSAIPGRSGKLARLTEMLEEVLAEGDRALVFTQFAEMGHILQRHLQETFAREAPFLHGSVPKKQRDAMIERFQKDENAAPIFLLSLKAGGTGLNLTRANHVFHFDRWWNPAVENQATDRAFRIGQTRNVQVHKFLCQGTLEERIDEMIESKKEIAAHVVGAGEGWLTELSTSKLKELFALRAEAVQV